jgi:antitoxin VapB
MATLQIRDPRAKELARQLADIRQTTMTEVVVTALEAELARQAEVEPLIVRIRRIADDLASKSNGRGRAMTKDEIDAMWGQ